VDSRLKGKGKMTTVRPIERGRFLFLQEEEEEEEE
jgi:hypothetical protein